MKNLQVMVKQIIHKHVYKKRILKFIAITQLQVNIHGQLVTD